MGQGGCNYRSESCNRRETATLWLGIVSEMDHPKSLKSCRCSSPASQIFCCTSLLTLVWLTRRSLVALPHLAPSVSLTTAAARFTDSGKTQCNATADRLRSQCSPIADDLVRCRMRGMARLVKFTSHLWRASAFQRACTTLHHRPRPRGWSNLPTHPMLVWWCRSAGGCSGQEIESMILAAVNPAPAHQVSRPGSVRALQDDRLNPFDEPMKVRTRRMRHAYCLRV